MREHQYYYFNYDNVFLQTAFMNFASVKAVMIITLGNHDFACEILAIGSRFSTQRFRDFIPQK